MAKPEGDREVKFEEALKAMREGKKVRLPDWQKKEHIRREHQLVGEDGHTMCSLETEWVLSEDWEIVE